MKKLELYSGNILNFTEGKDLIVNLANKYMIFGSGVCGAIYRAAGVDLLEQYCKSHFEERMKVNEVRTTPGFALEIDILHVFCPKQFESKSPLEELLVSYEKIFQEANNKGYKNIVSVSIGTGVHGYKHHDVAKPVMRKLKELTERFDINFTLVLPNIEILDLYSLMLEGGERGLKAIAAC